MGHTLELVCVAFNPLSTTIATGSMDQTCKLWDVNSGSEMCSLQQHSAEIVSLTFNQTGCLLLTGSFDKTARIWDARTGRCVHCLEGHEGEVRSLAFVASPACAHTCSHSDGFMPDPCRSHPYNSTLRAPRC